MFQLKATLLIALVSAAISVDPNTDASSSGVADQVLDAERRTLPANPSGEDSIDDSANNSTADADNSTRTSNSTLENDVDPDAIRNDLASNQTISLEPNNVTISNDTWSNVTDDATTPPPAPVKFFVDSREFETRSPDSDAECPGPTTPCESLPADCLNCSFDYSCRYGEKLSVTCSPRVECRGPLTFTREMICRYCFQTKFGTEHVCSLRNGRGANCHAKKAPTSQSRFKSNCTVKAEVLCLGRRSFNKMLPCNWTSGYRWTTALLLSVFLGGFGADRFYLGQWREGIGKLFSFGGLGVWTVIDVILIAIGYIGPEDGSLFIY